MPVHILYGDSFLVLQRLKQLEEETGARELLEANTHRLAGAQLKPPDLLGVCNALPFMDTMRLIVVEGLLSSMESRSRESRTGESRAGESRASGSRSRGGDSRQTSKIAGGWDQVVQAIPGFPDTTLLIFKDGPLAENNSLLRRLRPVAQVQQMTAPSGEALARWLKTAAQQKGAGLSPTAISLLTDLVGNDLWTLDQELEKLCLYATGRNIEESDVRELVPQVREANIFNAVDAMIEGRPTVALRLLHQLRQDGRDASNIIGMVGRQLRFLALARDLAEQGVPQRDLGSRLGITSQYALKKTVDQARRHTPQDIAWRYQRLLDADLAIKRGRLEPDLALELLVADLAGAKLGVSPPAR